MKEYEVCQNNYSNDFHLPSSSNFIPLIKNTSTNQSITTTIVIGTISLKKENITAGAIISFVVVLLIVTIVCLYIILSGHLFKSKNREKITDFIIRKKKQQDKSNGMQNLKSNHTEKKEGIIPNHFISKIETLRKIS